MGCEKYFVQRIVVFLYNLITEAGLHLMFIKTKTFHLSYTLSLSQNGEFSAVISVLLHVRHLCFKMFR